MQSEIFKPADNKTADMQVLQNTIKNHTDLEFTFDNTVCAVGSSILNKTLALRVSNNYFLFSWYPDS